MIADKTNFKKRPKDKNVNTTDYCIAFNNDKNLYHPIQDAIDKPRMKQSDVR